MFAPFQMVEEDMEGDVVMVRLGADEGGMEADVAEQQGSSYVELKPSTTLLVPLELMEEQDGLVDSSQLSLPELHQTIMPDNPGSENHSSFSLMLDVDEGVNEDADMPPMMNDLQFPDPPTLSPAVEASDEPVAKPEVILLDTDDQDPLLSGEASEEEQRKEMEILGGVHVDGALVNLADQADLQTQNPEANHEPEDAKEQVDLEFVMMAEDQEPAGLLVSGPSPVGELPAVVTDSMAEKDAVEEEMGVEEDKSTHAEDQEEPEENGPVNIDIEIACSTEMETVVEEKPQDNKASAETEEENNEEIKMETETERRGQGKLKEHEDVEEEKPGSDSQVEEQPVPETPSSQKKAPSTPTRRTTRAKTVTFIPPLPEEAEEPQEDEKVVEAETSTLVPASPRRTPRKSKQNKEVVQASTPRRSTRKAQQEPPKDEVEELVEAMDHDAAAAPTSKASSPARRRVSQRATSTRSSQSGSQEVSAATEVEIKAGQEDEVTDTKPSRRTSSKTPTPAKRRTTQGNTPRRSSRRTVSSSEAVPTPLEILKEGKEQDEVFASPVRRNSRKTKTEPSETQPAPLEEEEDKTQQVSSPSRMTRQSNRNTLNVYPQVRIHKCHFFASC